MGARSCLFDFLLFLAIIIDIVILLNPVINASRSSYFSLLLVHIYTQRNDSVERRDSNVMPWIGVRQATLPPQSGDGSC